MGRSLPGSPRSDADVTKPEDVPPRVLGHYMRDWLDPLLDRYQKDDDAGLAASSN